MSQTRFVVSALGSPIEVRIDTDAAPGQDLTPVVESWAWCRAPVGRTPRSVLHGVLDPASDPQLSLETDADAVPTHVTARTVDELAERLASAITKIALADQPDDYLLLHAAGLAHPETGAVVALVGPSGAGKSTASRVLGKHFVYYSDESVAVTPSGRVLPYQKPVSIKVPGSPIKRQATPESLGFIRTGSGLPRLRRLLVLERDAAHEGAPSVRRMDFPETIERIVPQTSYFPRGRRPLAAFSTLLEESGGALAVRYREATDLVATVADLLDDRHVEDVLTRSRVDDELDVDGNLAVLHEGTIRVLAGLGAEIWRLLIRPGTVGELANAIEEELGAPPEGMTETFVAAAVQRLVEAGLLVSRRLPR